MADLRQMMDSAAARPEHEPDVQEAFRKGRRARIARFGGMSIATVASVTAVALMAMNLTTPDRQRVAPAPDSDQGLIAFVTQGPKDPSPWVATVPVEGGDVTRLHEGRDSSWSPDGTRIAFGCDRGICTMNADGTDVRELTDPEAPAYDESPDWGPNGSIAFTRNYMDNQRLESARPRDIVVVGEEGGAQDTITNHDSDDLDPSWSPDGRSLAYVRAEGALSEAPPSGWHLWTMDADGGHDSRVENTQGAARPDWSPDGRSILFDNEPSLWTVSADGGTPRKLPVVTGGGSQVNAFASWAPDSRRFAFSCEHGICLSDIDSEEWTVLVTNGGSPAWQPILDPGPVLVASFGRYRFNTAAGFDGRRGPMENPGVVEINATEGTVCVDSYVPGATSAHIRREGDDPWRHIVIFEIPTPYRASMCSRGLDGPSLQAVIDDPTAHFIEFENKFSGETLTAPLEIMGDAFLDDRDRQDQLTEQQGRVACHDPDGDLMSEGSGDRSRPGPQAPDEQRDGTDLTGFSMGRYRDGTFEMNFGTFGRIPRSLAQGEGLYLALAGVPREGDNGFAAITATLRGDSWIVTARDGDAEGVILDVEPDIAGSVINLVIQADDVPRLMRGTFRWHAFSEWVPDGKGSTAYNDYCPDGGFPVFEGHTT